MLAADGGQSAIRVRHSDAEAPVELDGVSRLEGDPVDAVASAVASAGFTVHRLAVREVPRSGTPDQLLDAYGISARHIVAAVRS